METSLKTPQEVRLGREVPKAAKTEKRFISPTVSLLAGGIAGGVEAATTYPFEFAKTRLQLQNVPGGPTNPLTMIRQIVVNEGIVALYPGCSTLIVGTMFKASVRFLSFDTIKNQLADEHGKLSGVSGIVAGMVAGCVESIIAVTPTERIKTMLIDDARGPKRFSSVSHGIQVLIHEQGIRGMYKGLIPTVIKQSATSAVRMGSYNMLKESASSYNVPINAVSTFGIGSVAGIITVYATQPFDTLKTRVQSATGSSMKEAAFNVFKETGVSGFWKGSTMRLGRLILSGGIVFSVYEQVAAFLMKPRHIEI